MCVSLAGIQPHCLLIGSYGLGQTVLPLPQGAEAAVEFRSIFQSERVLKTSFRFIKPFQASESAAQGVVVVTDFWSGQDRFMPKAGSRGIVAVLIFQTAEQIQTVRMPWVVPQKASIAPRGFREISGTMVV